MWIPASEEELLAALAEGVVRESPYFDAKEALPRAGKNKDLAKDICAMTVDGGVLLYGVGGGDPTRPTKACPFELAGVAERIDQVAQTGIAEPPQIEIRDFASERESGKGYLAVVIPPSPRAPHMLILDGDNRYWGRGQTGNRILREGEVARLYERRERWELDRAALLDRAVAEIPFNFSDPIEQIGPMLVLARPVAGSSSLLTRAAREDSLEHFIGRMLPQEAARHDPYPAQGTSGLSMAFEVVPRGAGRWFVRRDDDVSFPYQALLDIRSDGEARYWHSPVINSQARRGKERLLIMEQSVTRAVYQLLGTVRWLYARAGYFGAIDMGVALLHIEQATAASRAQNMFDEGRPYGAPDYRHHERIVASELADLSAVTRRLLDPFFAAVSIPGYDPFEASQRV
jgi:hypothetical protein